MALLALVVAPVMVIAGVGSFFLFAGGMFFVLNGPLWLSGQARVFTDSRQGPNWLYKWVSWFSRLAGVAMLATWAWVSAGALKPALLLAAVVVISLFCLLNGPWRIITGMDILKGGREAPAWAENAALWFLRVVGVAGLLGALVTGACVQPGNNPVISSLQAEKDWVVPSGSSQIECAASDADGDILTYTWSATGGSFWGAGSVITWVAPDAPGTYAVTVAVADSKGSEVKSELALHVRDNHPPVIESLTARPRRVIKANDSTIECVAFDSDGDELTYRWEVSGGHISGTGATVTWTAPSITGSYTIGVIVTDSLGSGTSKGLEVTVICDCGG